ncbi:unnamed protein product [Calypogeia fissa]
MAWTGDGYVATVNFYNTLDSSRIEKYQLGWTWDKREIIYVIQGGRVTQQGDCTDYPAPAPVSCVWSPKVIDLAPGVSSGVEILHPKDAVAYFQITVGYAGNTNVTVKTPQKLSLELPGAGYTCGDLKLAEPTSYGRADHAYLTWSATCM